MSGDLSTWINELIPAGSDDYYRLLGLNQKKKQALQSLLCFFNNIDKVLLSTNDDAVCQQKLGWWQQEIANTYQDKASHPITKALAPFIKEHDLAMNSFNEYIESTQCLITNCRFDTFQDYLVFTMHCAGLREWLIAQVLTPNAIDEQQKLFQLALCIDLIDQLKQCRNKLSKGYIFFDNKTLATFSIARRDLLTLKTPIKFSELVSDHCQKARAAFEGTFTKLSKQQKKQLRPIIVRCVLGLKWCDSIKEEDYQIMQKHISLTPIRKWLFALFSRKN
jgi:15-cis-phytoene synthase